VLCDETTAGGGAVRETVHKKKLFEELPNMAHTNRPKQTSRCPWLACLALLAVPHILGFVQRLKRRRCDRI
jgi:hypothetical protein